MWAGQPRTGNAAYADLVEYIVGSNNIFRGKFPSSARAQFGQMNLIYPV